MALSLLAARQVLKIETKSGAGKFLVLRLDGQEHLSRIPEFQVELAGELDMMGKPKDVDLHGLLGSTAVVTMDVNDDPRQFNGFIVRMERGERRGRYETFTAHLRPWLWFLTKTKNSRVFQAKSVKDIVTEVLNPYSTAFEWRLKPGADYPKLDYCIQFAETDFDFVSRLLEEFGITYFFDHADKKSTMVMLDSMAMHRPKPTANDISWANAMKHDSTMINWHSAHESRSVKAVIGDHDYLGTATKIESTKAATKPAAKLGTMEVYEFPADVVQNGIKPEAQPATTAATARAGVLIEQLMALEATSTGTTNARYIAAGLIFKFAEAPRSKDNGKYLVISARYRIEFADYDAIEDLKTSGRRRDGFQCDIVAISTSQPDYRPPRVTPRPVAHGPQTALVVGKSDNEIETDKHGRVKIQFFWDRLGKKDENSSCWVRVAQAWAGKGFGLWTLPRVGHEVVVTFLEGNPDRPLVIGSVYNDANPIAYELPKLATVSGIKTQSSKQGTNDTASELRFEDAKDKEYIWFQAQKDYFRLVENDAFDFVQKNLTTKVKLTQKEVIGENWYLDVGKDVMHKFGKDHHTTVAGDIFLTSAATYQGSIDKDITIYGGGDTGVDLKGKLALKVGGDIVVSTNGKLSLKATGDLLGAGMNVHFKANANIVLEATAGITLKVGGSLVNIGPAGVDIVGPMVKINSGGGGGSATAAADASPAKPADAKQHEDIKPDKATDYDKLFEDPIKKDAK
jgi:type VI secretion system secreted protein VgrG